tara:strand:- start:15614 stop:16447 length:834 start_codon:yes stop_codon:yes gene_type:complete
MSLRLALALALASTLAAGCQEEYCALEYDRGAPLEDPLPGLRNPYTGQCDYYGGGGGGGGGNGGSCGDFGGSTEPAGDRAPIPDWGICDGFCESLVEDDCLQAEECRGAYSDPCLDGSDGQCEFVEPAFYQCWAVSPGDGYSEEGCSTYDAEECSRHNECSAVHAISNGGDATGVLGVFGYCVDEPGPTDPGSCLGMIECDALAPECPEDTVPGIADGCWTGYCIPVDDCNSLGACSEQSEQQCVGRADCEPVYEGIDCTCDGEDCTCAEWVFESCS